MKERFLRHRKYLDRLEDFLFKKPHIRIPLFLIALFLLRFLTIIAFDHESIGSSIASIVLSAIFTAYVFLFILSILRKSIKSLFKASSLWSILISYAIFMFSVIILMSATYSTTEALGKGYIKYGTCSDEFNQGMIATDTQKSNEYIYFSSVTLFSVGYGDICPMGFAKVLAVINAFIGNVITVIVMVLVISTYLKRKEDK